MPVKIEIVPTASNDETFDWNYVKSNPGVYQLHNCPNRIIVLTTNVPIYVGGTHGYIDAPNSSWGCERLKKTNESYTIKDGRVTFTPPPNEPLNLIGLPIGTVIEWENTHYGRILVEIIQRNAITVNLRQLGDNSNWSGMTSINKAKVLGTLRVTF